MNTANTSLTWLERIATDTAAPDWNRLTDVYAPLLHQWLGRAGVPVMDRDDIVQDVLLAVVRNVKDFEHRGHGAFRAWLRGILRHRVLDYFRARKRQPMLDLEGLARDDSQLSQLWDREHDAFLAVKALKIAEAESAPLAWQAFRLQVLDGLKPTEAATQLGVSTNMVLLAKSRILKRLRQELHGLV